MQRLRLFLSYRHRELDLGSAGDTLILWTYTREDADAPAAVRNSYTKSITLPGTPRNNAALGYMYRPDYADGFTVSKLSGLPFKLYNEASEVVQSGYLKIDSVTRRGEQAISWSVTLYGGLGSFIYGATYNDDGSKRTLADMGWLAAEADTETADPHEIVTPGIGAAWASLIAGDDREDASGLLNFVPALGGIPDGDFDAGKAYYKPGTGTGVLDGIPVSETRDGTTYGPSADGNGGVLLDLGAKVSGWEVQSLHATDCRPAISIRRFLKSMAAQDFGGWTLLLETRFFNSTNPYYYDAWLTIPTDNETNQGLDTWLAGTLSPADYLLAYAKTMGLVFVEDPVANTVTLMARDDYYDYGAQFDTIDLTDRTDGEYTLRPYTMQGRVYDFSNPVDGAFADYYALKYGRRYGDFLLDTSYRFGTDRIDVMAGVPMRGVAEVRPSSPWYFTQAGGGYYGRNHVKFPEYNEVTYLLYNGTASIKMTATRSGGARRGYDGQTNGHDLPLTLPQFCDADGKPTDGSHVLFFYTGPATLPAGSGANPCRWHLNTVPTAMRALNGGKACWNISPSEGVTQITQIPAFRRWYAGRSMDWGDPEEKANPDTIPALNLFSARWRGYLSDRFAADNAVMTTRVDLSGLRVGPDLLRRFFWFRGAVWVLNRITDYNPAAPGMTECEFVRVNDERNYFDSQRTA